MLAVALAAAHRPHSKAGCRMADRNTIRDVVGQVIVLAYKEDVQPLLAALEEERLPASLQRITYTPEEMAYALLIRLRPTAP